MEALRISKHIAWSIPIIVGLSFIISPKKIFAQSTSSEFNTITTIDTARIQRLIREANKIRYSNSDSALVLLKKAKELSVQSLYPDGIAETFNALGVLHTGKGDFKIARQYFQQALAYCKYSVHKKQQRFMRIYTNMAEQYSMQGRDDSAIAYALKALQYAAAAKDTLQMILVNNNISAVLIHNNKFSEALYYLHKAEKYSAAIKDSSYLRLIFGNFSIVYDYLNDTAKHYKYAVQSLAIAKLNKENQKIQAPSLSALAGYYLKINDPANAIIYFKKALQFTDTNNAFSKLFPVWGIGEAYFMQGNYNKALPYTEQALEIAKQSNLRNKSLANLYAHAAKVYDKLGSHKQAYKYQLAYSDLSDSLNTSARNKDVDRLEAKRRLYEKDKEIIQNEFLLLRQQSRLKSKNFFILLISLAAILTILIFFTIIRSYRRKMKIMGQQEEINALKAMGKGEENERKRIARELHDGVSGLLSAASINLNTLGEKYPIQSNTIYIKTEALLKSINIEVRKIAYNLMPDIVLQHSLPDAIRLYCSYIRKEKQIIIHSFGAFDHIDLDLQLAIYRIVQELIQNALKHANASTIMIQLHADKTLLSVTVEDNGIGYDPDEIKHGLGINNIHTRVSSLHGSISIDAKPGKGVSVYIEFDLHEK